MGNLLIQAVLLGGYYALIACGLSFMYSVMKVINLAHGSFAILAAYILWYLADRLSVSLLFGVLFIIPVMALIGWVFQKALLERTSKGGSLLPILTTFGLAIVIDNVLFQLLGADTRSLAPFLGELSWASWELPGGIHVAQLNVVILAAAILLLGGIQISLRSTALGRGIRATAADPDTAGLVGVNAKRASAIASSIAFVTVGIAGAALGIRGIFDAYSGAPQLLFAFEATVIGGVGSLWGTLIGGIVLAAAQTFGATLHPQGFLLGGHIAFLVVVFVRLYVGRGSLRERLKALVEVAR